MKSYEQIKKMDHHELAEAHAQALIENADLRERLSRCYMREDAVNLQVDRLRAALKLNQAG